MTGRLRSIAAGLALALAVASGCSGSDDDGSPDVDSSVDAPDFVTDVRAAIAAVEDELGQGQEFFEVTSNEQFVNVFVAVDDGTAAVPYLYFDGELQPPAPRLDGASGSTFTAGDVLFDESLVLSGVEDELPETSIDEIIVIGDGVGAAYELVGRSDVGGTLLIQVTPTGDIISVDPV
ncbi:MAG: hypothetical protein AAF945_06210 [Actinomycetota bacterium]